MTHSAALYGYCRNCLWYCSRCFRHVGGGGGGGVGGGGGGEVRCGGVGCWATTGVSLGMGGQRG